MPAPQDNIGNPVQRVLATPAALAVIERLKKKYGPLMFHQSGGCCDGSAPMCFQLGELLVGDNDVLLGEVDGCPFYMSASQYNYWKHTQLIIDALPGAAEGFSLEGLLDVHFLTRSRVFSPEEYHELEAAGLL
ncbi:MAG: DUF779 domain-containing protein [Thermoguttaceae bacterium]